MDTATLDRLHEETAQLKERISKLVKFTGTQDFAELSLDDRIDLNAQRQHMEQYLLVLERRLSRQARKDEIEETE